MYVVERKVASGGMASVYRGYDPSLDRPVAIKVLRPELATAIGAERFLREARHLAQVSHPNIVAIHEVGEADGLYFYVMDLVEAPTLEHLLREGGLSVGESVRITADLLKALEAVHAAGLIHRDVKPGNIFVLEDRAILGDFGIAKTVDAKGTEPLTTEGQVVGTPGYMAPEQQSGVAVTPRADLYAVGLVLFRCLTGRDWTSSESIPITLSEVPSEFREIVSRAVAPDPDDRWPDAAAFRTALLAAAPAGVHSEGPVAGRRLGGRRLVRPIVVLVAVSVVAAIGLTALGRRGGSDADGAGVPAVPDADTPAVVVVPCENLSPDPALAYYAGEIAVELTHALGNVRGLEVLGQTTALTLQDTQLSARAIGEALEVDFLVGCSVLRGGDSLRISARLEDTETGRQLWSDVSGATDINEVAGRVTRGIVGALAERFPVDDPGSLVRGQSQSLEAFDLYTKGRNAWSRRTEPALAEAERYFRQALEIDPGYAVAYGGLADVYAVLTARGFRDMPPDSAFPIARRFAERAIQLAPGRAEPHAALAETLRAYFWEDWAEAGERYRRAIDLNPSYADAHTWYSLYLAAMGRHEAAISEARRAVDIEPRSPNMATGLARAHFYNRDFAAALTELSRAIELDPDFAEARLWMIGNLIKLGRHEEALQLLSQASGMVRLSPLYHALLAYGFSAVGEPARAQELLDALESSDTAYVPPFWIAVTLGEMGRLDEAFDALSRAYELRDEFMVLLAVSPFADPLRADARFTEWVGRMAALVRPEPAIGS